MIILNFLRRLFTGPVELLMEVFFTAAKRVIPETGLIISLISAVMSFLVILICHWAADSQLRHYALSDKNNRGKTSFLRHIPLFLIPEILYFTAGFLFFNNLVVLYGVPFLFISDLGVPDGMIRIEGLSLNLLPILVIVIHVISNRIRTRDFPLVWKILTGAETILFFFLLYSSHAGFTLYWLVCELLQLAANAFFRHRSSGHSSTDIHPSDKQLFLLSCIYTAILTGIQIPSMVIRSAPSDFINISNYYSPFHYIISAFVIAAGTFVIWPGMAFAPAPAPVRKSLAFLSALTAVCGTINVMFFGNDRGIMSTQLVYEKDPVLSPKAVVINLLILGLTALVIWLIRRKNRVVLNLLIAGLCVVKAGSAVSNCISIARDLSVSKKTIAAVPHLPEIEDTQSEDTGSLLLPEIPLSADGKNVVVIMMDRSIGYFLPFILAERPELMEQFDGFTFYPNTLSFGSKTNEAAPALFGGYEYTPERINERKEETLASKHNEALRLMPVLFDEAGYRVTVFDPPYAGYQTIPDLNIYSDHPGIRAWHAEDMLPPADEFYETEVIMNRNRNFFCYSIYRISPLFVQPLLYNKGSYNKADTLQSFDEMLSARRDLGNFQKAYNVLVSLPSMTEIKDSGNTFFIMDNRTTHEPTLPQLPDYSLTNLVDNTPYETLPITRTSADGRTLLLNDVVQETHYHVNMAAFIALGAWLDHLKENHVYDNTRIIIVSDHGHPMGYSEFMFGSKDHEDVLTYNPMFMVKDFNSKGFSVDTALMTNADTPSIAFAGLLEAPSNPATGQPVTDRDKFERDILIKHTEIWDNKLNNGDSFRAGDWYLFHGQDIFDTTQWEFTGRH